jgi:hypothetical protein
MKISHLFLAAATLISQVSFGKTIATLNFGVLPQGGRLSSYDVSLSDTFVLQVTDLDHVATPLAEKKLSVEVVEILISKVVQLSSAKITNKTNPSICMTFVPVMPVGPQYLTVATDFDYQSQSFSGPLVLAQSPSGCYLHSHTAPANVYGKILAAELSSSLMMLALDAIEANN